MPLRFLVVLSAGAAIFAELGVYVRECVCSKKKKEGACSKTPGLEKARKGIVQGHLVRRGGRCCSRRRRRTGKRAGVRAPWGFINGVRIRRCLPRRACACAWRDDSVRAAWRAGRTGGRGVGHFHKPAHPSIHPPSSHIPNAASPPARLRRYLVKNGGGGGERGEGTFSSLLPQKFWRDRSRNACHLITLLVHDRTGQAHAARGAGAAAMGRIARTGRGRRRPGKALGGRAETGYVESSVGTGTARPARGGRLSWTTSTAPHGPRFA